MKFLKRFYMISIATSLLVCSITYADTCYDPNYDRYYNCGGDEYIAPVVAGLLIGALLYNSDGDGGYRHHYHRYHDGYHGDHHGGHH